MGDAVPLGGMIRAGFVLHVLRHAHSSWALPGQRDHERPLDERGRREVRALAEALRSQPPIVDRIVCSTATRARETLDAVRVALPPDVEVEFSDDLYALGPQAYFDAAERHRDRAGLLLVGHNPTIEEFAAALCTEGTADALGAMRRGVGTAHWLTIEIPDATAPIGPGSGFLAGLRVP